MALHKKKNIRQSFSRVGMPGDNAWSESFFANLKKEAVHWCHFETRSQACEAMFECIEGFYNTRVYAKISDSVISKARGNLTYCC